jgi:hypothetical protein
VVEIIELSDSEQPVKKGKAAKEKERQPKRKPDDQIQKNIVLNEEETRRISRHSRRQRREAEQTERARMEQERVKKEREQARIRHMVRLELSNCRLLQKVKTNSNSDILVGPEHQADLPLHLASQGNCLLT